MPTSKLKAYLELCRISNLPSIWTNVLCAFLLTSGAFSWPAYLVPALSLSCFYLAGMCLNDICDAGHDRIHRPARPLPSGRVSTTGAWLLTLSLFAAGFALLLTVPHRQSLYVAALLAAAIILYDLRHKKNPLSVLLMASCRLLVFAVTAVAVSGEMTAVLLAASGVQFAYVICISLVARKENSRSVPFTLPVIPLMLTGICLLDGIMLAVLVKPVWLLAGIAGGTIMFAGQRFVKGD